MKTCNNCNYKLKGRNTPEGIFEYYCHVHNEYRRQDDNCEVWKAYTNMSERDRINAAHNASNQLSSERRHEENLRWMKIIGFGSGIIGALVGTLGTLLMQYYSK